MQTVAESLISIHEIRPIEAAILETKSYVLISSNDIEVSQILLNPGEEFQLPKSLRDRTIQVLNGRAILTFEEQPLAMIPGYIALLAPSTEYRLSAVDSASILCTLVLPDDDDFTKENAVLAAFDQTIQDSFPASDPPSSVPVVRS